MLVTIDAYVDPRNKVVDVERYFLDDQVLWSLKSCTYELLYVSLRNRKLSRAVRLRIIDGAFMFSPYVIFVFVFFVTSEQLSTLVISIRYKRMWTKYRFKHDRSECSQITIGFLVVFLGTILWTTLFLGNDPWCCDCAQENRTWPVCSTMRNGGGGVCFSRVYSQRMSHCSRKQKISEFLFVIALNLVYCNSEVKHRGNL